MKAEFGEQETEPFAKRTLREQMPPDTLEKMQQLSLTDYFNEMPGNFSALLKLNRQV